MGCRPYRRNNHLGLYGVALMLSSPIWCVVDRLDPQRRRRRPKATLQRVAATLLVQRTSEGDGPTPAINQYTHNRARQLAPLDPAGPDHGRVVLVLSLPVHGALHGSSAAGGGCPASGSSTPPAWRPANRPTDA